MYSPLYLDGVWIGKGWKRRIEMNSFEQLIGNRVLVSAVVGWFVAQVLKTVIHTIVTKSLSRSG